MHRMTHNSQKPLFSSGLAFSSVGGKRTSDKMRRIG
jgi:hypothetical protein